MIKLDIDTILRFRGEVNGEKCICFYGEQESTWSILYKRDRSLIKSQKFYKVINPTESQIILNIYIFSDVTDALTFYYLKGVFFFSNSLIVIVDEQSKKEAAEYLRMRFNNFTSKAPKLNFFHRPQNSDLYLFYLDLLNLNIIYEKVSRPQGLILNLKYKTIKLSLSFSELNKLRFFLGINDRKFKIKNKVLTPAYARQFITW